MTSRGERERTPGDEPETAARSAVEGLGLGETATVRSGEDARRRGWFWHWNSIVTQYAPLLGLKGVGLLNSYTVWTDRREESPHRGYAFPSQQSEADFYGEDRAELITINKILVALDLIEIRKEMVLRTDPQGRRWRVPHNFYRVKDLVDGFALTERDVLRVAALADHDRAVYRYVRRVFSPRFAPIDADNVWHRILPAVRPTELWQRLATRAEREEDRASARTRAGHAARRAAVVDAQESDIFVPMDGDETTTAPTHNDTTTDETTGEEETVVATVNRGSGVDVAQTNSGLPPPAATLVDESNPSHSTAVAPANTTYYQSDSTTTTSNEQIEQDEGGADGSSLGISGQPADSDTVDQLASEPGDEDALITSSAPWFGTRAAGPHGSPAPADGPGELAAIRAFEAANARAATPAERTLLRGLAEQFDGAAVAANRAAPSGYPLSPPSGWGWLAAAVYEAVESGSAFVAPRRLREILGRWEREGYPQNSDSPRPPTRARTTGNSTARPARVDSPEIPGEGSGMRPARPVDLLGGGPDFMLPHGHGSRQTWAFAVGLLGGALDGAVLAELVAGTAIAGYRDGEVTIAVPDAIRAERLATVYRELVTRKLSEAMRRPVRLAVLTQAVVTDSSPPEPAMAASGAAAEVAGGFGLNKAVSAPPEEPGAMDAEPDPPSFVVAECGLPSGQVWAAVLGEVATSGMVSRANFDAWLRATRLIGRAPHRDGTSGTPLIVGVSHPLAVRRVGSRFLPALRAAVFAVLGTRLDVEIVVARDWLAGQLPHQATADETAPRRATGG